MMTVALWLFFLYVVPLWFLFRAVYFANQRDMEYSWKPNVENVEVGFAVFFILVLSWIGFFIGAMLIGVNRADMARTFFIPKRKDSMASKIFWYKVRVLGLRLLFIKESE